MKGYMYILKCANGSYYTGSTTDLEQRLEQHKNGEGAKFTKKHLPVELVYVEEFSKIEDAFYREKQIQGWSRKKKEALIAGNFDKLHELAECKNDTKASAPTPFDLPRLRSVTAVGERSRTVVGERSRTDNENGELKDENGN